VLAVGDCDLVAFCDDRDTWSPTKLTAQVAVMGSRPGTLLCTCAAEVEYDGHRTPQLIGHGRLGPAALTRARAAALRPSGVVASQRALATPERRGGIGLSTSPRRPARGLGPVGSRRPARADPAPGHRPGTAVVVGAQHRHWRLPGRDRRAAVDVDRHPELHQPRVFSDLACWYAAAGDRRGTWHWVLASLRHWAVDRRGLRAVAVSAGLLSRRSRAIGCRNTAGLTRR
jgi:hypothetical protein